MAADRKDIETIRAIEQRVLLREVRHSREELEKILADDFYEVGTSGQLFDRQMIIDTLVSESRRELIMKEFQATVLAEDVILATYRILRLIEDQMKASSRHCSVWKKRDDDWWMVYHQGTLEPKSESNERQQSSNGPLK
ncbi:MAG: DUF4440 domain-containing protein [bacterium]